MRKLLEKIGKEKLLDFLVEYAENDDRFTNAIKVRFEKPELEDELDKIENMIISAFDGISDYRTHDSWGYASLDLGHIYAEICERMKQGRAKLAFAELELLYRQLLENFEYQGECELSDEADYCLDKMSEAADIAVLPEDKDYIFRRCIELTDLPDGKDYGADYEDKLLKIAAKFVTPENHRELESILSRYDSGWRAEEFKLIQLEIVRRISGEDAADKLIAENLQFTKIRDIAFDNAISKGDFTKAERLCIDALSEFPVRYGISPWLYKLYSVYEMTENGIKMVEYAEKILLEGDLKYYDKLKALLLKQGVWNSAYSDLLHKCEIELHHVGYMEILKKEKEDNLLMEQVKKHPEQVYNYGILLASQYPAEICAIFSEQITKEAETATNRDKYRDVCSRVLLFKNAGFKPQASEMIERFKTVFKRRPAFVDELNKIGGRINE